jgi:2-desacetyl-2-hydroxyethyl bacteriochlorophyllide A dehydrogenase
VSQVVQFTGPRMVEVADEPPPALPSDSVRVRTRYSGISAGTELTAYRGTNPYLTRSWDPSERLFHDDARGLEYPVSGWGYSEVGVVIEIGADAAGLPGLPAVGDLVWGIWGHRSVAVLPATRLIGRTLFEGLEPIAATFGRVGVVALNAVLAADLHLGEVVAVFGQGVLGLLVTRLATLSGASVVAVDAMPQRLERARAFGAVEAIDVRAGHVAERVRELTTGRRTGYVGADVAIDMSGAYPALHEAIRAVGPGGRVVAAGFYQGDATGLRLGEEFHHNRVSLICSQIGGVPQHLAQRWDEDRLQRVFLQHVASGAIDAAALVSHVIPVADAAAAYQLLDERPADALQIVLEFPEDPSC